jgi:hypothetical protein
MIISTHFADPFLMLSRNLLFSLFKTFYFFVSSFQSTTKRKHMRIRFLPAIFGLLVISSCNETNKKPDISPGSVSQSVNEQEIKQAVDDAYKSISFKQGEKVNFDSIRKCFMPQAQFFDFRNDTLEILTLEQFITAYKSLLDGNGIHSFYEEEMAGRSNQFGRIAQRISSYKTFINTMDSAAERGVNSFQLVHTPAGWKVTSIIWDVESAKLKIPAWYLKQDSLK